MAVGPLQRCSSIGSSSAEGGKAQSPQEHCCQSPGQCVLPVSPFPPHGRRTPPSRNCPHGSILGNSFVSLLPWKLLEGRHVGIPWDSPIVSTLCQEVLQKIFLNIPTVPYISQPPYCLSLWQALSSTTPELPNWHMKQVWGIKQW
jgi:hypothetical protein